MKRPVVCILGDELSGLATGVLLRHRLPSADVFLIANGQRQGCRSQFAGGKLIELGLHSSILSNRRGREALGLIKLLRCENHLKIADIKASYRTMVKVETCRSRMKNLLSQLKSLVSRESKAEGSNPRAEYRLRCIASSYHVMRHGLALISEPFRPSVKNVLRVRRICDKVPLSKILRKYEGRAVSAASIVPVGSNATPTSSSSARSLSTSTSKMSSSSSSAVPLFDSKGTTFGHNCGDIPANTFFNIRFGKGMSRKFCDPVCYSMYGVGVNGKSVLSSVLSIKSSFPRMYSHTERKGSFSSIFWGGFISLMDYNRSWLCLRSHDPLLLQVVHRKGRVYSFKGGMEYLAKRLEKEIVGFSEKNASRSMLESTIADSKNHSSSEISITSSLGSLTGKDVGYYRSPQSAEEAKQDDGGPIQIVAGVGDSNSSLKGLSLHYDTVSDYGKVKIRFPSSMVDHDYIQELQQYHDNIETLASATRSDVVLPKSHVSRGKGKFSFSGSALPLSKDASNRSASTDVSENTEGDSDLARMRFFKLKSNDVYLESANENGETVEITADVVVSALKAPDLAGLLEISDTSTGSAIVEDTLTSLRSIPHLDCAVVSLRWKSKDRLQKTGMYLCPSTSDVSTVVIHSELFKGKREKGTLFSRFTSFLSSSRKMNTHNVTMYIPMQTEDAVDPQTAQQVNENRFREIALLEAASMLGLNTEDVETEVELHKESLPLYTLGHETRLKNIESGLPHTHLVGRSYRGVQAADEIADARRVVDKIVDEYG